MKARCRNCGLLHETKVCPSYGPMFPAPGKTREDYEHVAKQIADRVARDIVAEHGDGEQEEGEVIKIAPKRRKKALVQGPGQVQGLGGGDPSGESPA